MTASFTDSLEVIARVLACDLACASEELHAEGVLVTEAREIRGRRGFPFHTPSLFLASMGSRTVISCNRERMETVRSIAEGFTAAEIFSASGLWLLQEAIMPDGQLLLGPQVKHICTRKSLRPSEPPEGYTIERVDREGLPALHAVSGFAHAMTRELEGPRPDVMALIATYEGAIVGVAGVTADCEELWQMGIEVAPDHQGQGLAKALVSRLASAILDEDRIPYYSTELGNIRSSALATSAGFRPAWVEAFTNCARTFPE